MAPKKKATDGDAVDTNVNDANVNKDGTYVGTEDAPQQPLSPNTDADPFPHEPTTGHRLGEKLGGEFTTTVAEGEDEGKTLTWNDPDAIPGTVGDDPEETMRALHAAGSAAVKAE